MPGLVPATRASSNDEQCRYGQSHDESILMAVAGAVGRWRGMQPASKVSLMTMRPPQHGQGWAGLSVAVPSDASLRWF